MEHDPIMFERLKMAIRMAKGAAAQVKEPNAGLLGELEKLEAAVGDGRITAWKQPPVNIENIIETFDQVDHGLGFVVEKGDFGIRDGKRTLVVHRASVASVSPRIQPETP